MVELIIIGREGENIALKCAECFNKIEKGVYFIQEKNGARYLLDEKLKECPYCLNKIAAPKIFKEKGGAEAELVESPLIGMIFGCAIVHVWTHYKNEIKAPKLGPQ